MHTGRFNVKNVVASTTGEPSKLKVKVRVTNHGVFGIMNAYIVEKTIVEEPVVEAAPAKPTNGQTETQGEAKEEDKQTGEQPSQDKNKTKEGASSSDEPTTKGDSQGSKDAQQQQEEAMDTGNTAEQGQRQSVSERCHP